MLMVMEVLGGEYDSYGWSSSLSPRYVLALFCYYIIRVYELGDDIRNIEFSYKFSR